MLSCNRLGNLGRLANQMFQYASLKGIASHRGYEYCIPPREIFGVEDGNVKNSDCGIYDVFSILDKNIVKLTDNQIVTEKYFHFNEDLFENCSDNVDLLGYFQSEKYFNHIKTEIRKDFTFNEELFEQCSSFTKDTFDSEIISIHVRRGDYTINPNHPLQEMDYYTEGLSKLPSNLPVIVFSDDPEWCKNQKEFDSDRFLISENNSTDFDLCLMTLCDYHIIANSSFSWWGSWLSNSKITIAPKNWFGGSCINHNTKDLYCKNWILLG